MGYDIIYWPNAIFTALLIVMFLLLLVRTGWGGFTLIPIALFIPGNIFVFVCANILNVLYSVL